MPRAGLPSRQMSELPKPEVIITHESDLDGFVAGHLLQRLAQQLFNTAVPLQAWNYTNWEQRNLRERTAWVTDLSFTPRLDKAGWVIVDHHHTDTAPQHAQLIHDATKSATLLCYELCAQHGLGSEKLARLAHLTNVGDLYLTADPDFVTAVDYGALIKQYLFWNIHDLIGDDLEALVDHPLLEVVATRRRVENPLGYAYSLKNLTPLSDTVALVDTAVGDTNAIVHRLLEEKAAPQPVLATLTVRARTVSVSLRSRNGEALGVAQRLQGGGHPNAAGATLPHTIQRIPDAMEYLKRTLDPKTAAAGSGLQSLASAFDKLGGQ